MTLGSYFGPLVAQTAPMPREVRGDIIPVEHVRGLRPTHPVPCSKPRPSATGAEYNVGMLGRIVHWPLAACGARAMPRSNDEELLAGLRRRDPHSIAKLYDLYGSQVYRLILDRVGCPCIADDLVVQTFLLAWNRARQRSSQPTTLFPWLKSLAKTCAADYMR